MSDLLSKNYLMKFSDGSTWAVPVSTIAMHHANTYCDGDMVAYLNEKTLPLFSDPLEIEDWAKNNMNWSDVVNDAVKVYEPKTVDYQHEWINCSVKIR